MIDQLNVQDYMQSHLLGCMVEVGKRIKDFPNVLGFDSLNEPRRGWIGRPFSERKTKSTRNDPAMLGLAWSPLDALYCSHGHSIDVPYNELSLLKGGFVPKRLVRVNDDRVSIWLPGRTDPFQEAGAWRLDGNGNGTVLHEDFFQVANGKRVDFDRDCMFPFIDRVGESIRNVNPDWMVFAEKDCVSSAFDPSFPESITPNAVNATHWYDNATVGTKKFHYPFTLDVTTKQLVFGTRGIQAMYERNLGDIARASERINGGCPTVIGECGIPYDLDNGKAFREWERGNHGKKIWKSHVMALDLLYNALDALLLSSAQWNYNAHNKNDPLIGDGWNQEDCSIFSEDQHDNPRDINSGGRVLDGFLRPFARRIQGTPLLMMYQRKKGQFTLGLKPDASIARPTEIYVPRYQYPSGITLEAGNADVTIQEGKQLVLIKARDDNELLIKIKGKKNK